WPATRLGGWGFFFSYPATLRFHAPAQCIHQIDDFCWRTLFRCLDLLTRLLLLQQFLQCILVMIFKVFRPKMPRFGRDDVRGQVQHVLWNLFIWDILEVFVVFAHLVGIAQRNPEKALTARLQCNDVLARGEDNPPERHHAFLADRLTNNSEGLLANFAVGSEVIW